MLPGTLNVMRNLQLLADKAPLLSQACLDVFSLVGVWRVAKERVLHQLSHVRVISEDDVYRSFN